MVEQCNNFDSTDEIACVYTIRVGPSYSGYPADLDDDAESITAGEEGAFRRIISQKFPDRALDWPAQDNFTGSIAVPPYQLLRIKQRYFKCGDYYVWPTSEVVTDYVKQSRLVYSNEPELRTCQPTIWVETTLECIRDPANSVCVYSAALRPYKLRDPDVPSDEGLPLSESEEEDLKRILSRELPKDFPKSARIGDFTYTTRLPPGQNPRVTRRNFRCGPYIWPSIQF